MKERKVDTRYGMGVAANSRTSKNIQFLKAKIGSDFDFRDLKKFPVVLGVRIATFVPFFFVSFVSFFSFVVDVFFPPLFFSFRFLLVLFFCALLFFFLSFFDFPFFLSYFNLHTHTHNKLPMAAVSARHIEQKFAQMEGTRSRPLGPAPTPEAATKHQQDNTKRIKMLRDAYSAKHERLMKQTAHLSDVKKKVDSSFFSFFLLSFFLCFPSFPFLHFCPRIPPPPRNSIKFSFSSSCPFFLFSSSSYPFLF